MAVIGTTRVPKTTAYPSLRSKNPTLKTFSKLLHATCQKAIRKPNLFFTRNRENG
jgi:hypothetical protein